MSQLYFFLLLLNQFDFLLIFKGNQKILILIIDNNLESFIRLDFLLKLLKIKLWFIIIFNDLKD